MTQAAVHPAIVAAPEPALARAMSSLAFGIFILANAVLFMRPMDVLVPTMRSAPLYDWLMIITLLLALPEVLGQLRTEALVRQSVTFCVIGVGLAVVLSHAVHFRLASAQDAGTEFAKIILYYLLVAGLVNSPGRMRVFIACIAFSITILAVLPLLQVHGVIQLGDLEPLRDFSYDPKTRKTTPFLRLCGPGIFHDPNDFCHILTAGIPLCLYRLFIRRPILGYLPWLAALGAQGYAIVLTKSRGGFIALLAAIGALLVARLGWRKSIVAGAIVLPALFVVFAGRQTELSASSQTGHERILLWAQAMAEVRQYPLFGIGQGEFSQQAGLVAHNSFLHCFAELGFIGGTFFLGIWGLSLLSLFRAAPIARGDPEILRLRPYLLAAVAAYVAGMMSLTRSYAVVTYTLPGLTAAYLALVAPSAAVWLNWRMLHRLAGASLAFLLFMHLFIRMSIHLG